MIFNVMELTIGETVITKRKQIDFEDHDLKIKGCIDIVNDKTRNLSIFHQPDNPYQELL